MKGTVEVHACRGGHRFARARITERRQGHHVQGDKSEECPSGHEMGMELSAQRVHAPEIMMVVLILAIAAAMAVR